MIHPPQSMVNVDARNYPAHVERRNLRLADTNHAGQISTRCPDCRTPMDVGWERFHTPVFQTHRQCYTCTTKETP
ncbi:hypothetical protein SEA_ECLIPTUS_102 [Gordonia phage Ecliptus]|uniref:DNA binding protein n=3 Tax=Caudoviricetes TaxID=2731619 RepID=A0A345L1A1_9CAUD|nr:hypothetical protein HOT72_gp094 [Gordonia phage Apricot]YP_009808332.1 hypothetical protein HOT93_gp055 [Gordonia phage Horus]YP_009808434.1 DNA binding protein [Gordonia phage Phistory]QYC53761.1 hypothetical protein SEA_LEROY_95 [Gordonia phage Leroy]UTN91557.1 hypothetical protein SEA_PERIWINKLE_103 [Gordonia phage Periwinkle]WAB10667.1 hypothetical protein SEA_ECLIPTUS_102 [Gordonia phage Ecliptus]WNM69801.1 hypothetical protein SEA_CRATER_94 [Gordonia phage Crater]AXH49053.1 hypothe